MAQTRAKDTYERATWRLIDSGLVDGASNMAIDEAVHSAVGANQSPSTIRFSGWNPGFLSLGQEQPWDIVDEEGCQKNGWDIVGRPTQGRAILHVDGFSISVTMPSTDSRALGEDTEPFKRVSSSLISALKSMGLDPDRSRPYYQDRGPLGLACYDGPSEYQVTVGGRKLVCGDVLNTAEAVSIYCTIPLFGDMRRIADALRFEMPGQRMALAARLGYRATTLESAMGRRIDQKEASDAFIEGLAKVLNLSFEQSELSERESAQASELRAGKYGSSEWISGSQAILD